MNDIVKSCIICANPCDYYFNQIAKQCADMFGEDASNLRQATAWGCSEYNARQI